MSKAEAPNGLAKFGLLGLGVMGQNLALNIERNGYPIAVWTRKPEGVDEFIQTKAQGKQISGTHSIEDLVRSLERPRRVLMMVKAGDPVDWTIDILKPHLEKGDIIIDGGNSHFPDTIRREAALAREGLKFFGVGVSGGEMGALWGTLHDARWRPGGL